MFLLTALMRRSHYRRRRSVLASCADNLAAKFIYPNPLNPERLIGVHEGVGLDGLKLSTFFTALYSGAGLPDFMIFDENVKLKGWGGVIAAGFFDSDWQCDERLYYLQE